MAGLLWASYIWICMYYGHSQMEIGFTLEKRRSRERHSHQTATFQAEVVYLCSPVFPDEQHPGSQAKKDEIVNTRSHEQSNERTIRAKSARTSAWPLNSSSVVKFQESRSDA